MSCNGRPEERQQRAGENKRSQAGPASDAASWHDALSKSNPSSAASAAAAATAAATAAHPKSVPAAAAAASAPPAAPAPRLAPPGRAHAAPDRGPEGDDDPAPRDPPAAQEHTHKPSLQRGGGDARSSALAASPEPAETCCGAAEIPRASRVPAAHTWARSQQFQPASPTSSPGPVEGPTPAAGARPFLLRSFR